MQQNGIIGFISKLLAIVQIGGNMSEQGADKAGLAISDGIKFFFKSLGMGIFIALILWLLPSALKGLSEFILALR
ncbi:hypothetical protein ACU6T4_03510 [Avibacterium paragallinarum]|uniref:hypothetical protein n=1 Tax=Avibacterium paragallinarum TaxID=728 RepID=UPI00021AD010|nr:hypothetical protein [Avibacterium paragallinarum]AZI13442.1 hypothetical protein EIA51_01580 [Avibacterium paragallinarum]QIR10778.1 hypothetical protein HBL79_12240 [Avibacterium paragallinarum]QJE08829.1 hypothetical protein HHJ62_11565 [Avibacterium paragallinarum]QJE11026.1 hypothetical protein HHJ61_11565 [Avibacterium paragallinarum]QJE13223.1 hypothetical protein HHJ60_11595 [Avibacterium paragallinarum]